MFFSSSLSSCKCCIFLTYPVFLFCLPRCHMYVVYVWTGGWLISLVLVTSDNKVLLLLLLLPRGFLRGRYHLSAQSFPENAGPYGSGFAGTSVGSASHATHPVLAEADGSIRYLASRTPPRNCDSGLCISPGLLKGPPLAKAHEWPSLPLYALPPITQASQETTVFRKVRKVYSNSPPSGGTSRMCQCYSSCSKQPHGWSLETGPSLSSEWQAMTSTARVMCGRSTGAFCPPRACPKHDGRS